MLREEVKYASKDYVNYLLDKQEYHNEKYTEHDIKQAFEKGAKWADEHQANVWHDASEEPAGDNWEILCVDIHNGCWVDGRVNALLLHNRWDEYADIELVKMWAYVNDLLPKGGEE